MERKSALDLALAGQNQSQGFDLFATHPRTAERARRSVEAATGSRVSNPVDDVAVYLGKIDGMIYGDDPAQGFVHGTEFAHPVLGLRFEVPAGYRLLNGMQAVMAQGPDNRQIRFDGAEVPPGTALMAYLHDGWAKGRPLRGAADINVNGMPAATAVTDLTDEQGRKTAEARLVVVRMASGAVYRMTFVAPGAGRSTIPSSASVRSSPRKRHGSSLCASPSQRFRPAPPPKRTASP
jgi:predicted Zn-dependent protease